jgi:hypothetical protein
MKQCATLTLPLSQWEREFILTFSLQDVVTHFAIASRLTHPTKRRMLGLIVPLVGHGSSFRRRASLFYDDRSQCMRPGDDCTARCFGDSDHHATDGGLTHGRSTD